MRGSPALHGYLFCGAGALTWMLGPVRLLMALMRPSDPEIVLEPAIIAAHIAALTALLLSTSAYLVLGIAIRAYWGVATVIAYFSAYILQLANVLPGQGPSAVAIAWTYGIAGAIAIPWSIGSAIKKPSRSNSEEQ